MPRLARLLALVVVLPSGTWMLAACAAEGASTGAPATPVATDTHAKEITMELASDAFRPGQPIPEEYTCDGDNISPPLRWQGVPTGAKGLALICRDPDAPGGTWVHWVLYDLPVAAAELAESQPASLTLPSGGRHGHNSFKNIGYGGPCPPRGKPHRYVFVLYALDAVLGLEPGASESEVVQAMDGHVLAQGELIGTYQRR